MMGSVLLNTRINELERLIESVDEAASIENARKCLSKYRQLARMAGKTLTDLQSPTITDMPAGGPKEMADDKIIKRLDAKSAIDSIEYALYKMDPLNAQIIYLSYTSRTYHTMEGVALLTNMSMTTLKRHKKEALFEFAEYYDGGILLEKEKALTEGA